MATNPISLPKDNQAHQAIIEWWYFNGHLSDAAGNSYSFMDCLFKADAKKIKIPFLKKLPFKENAATKPYVFFAHSVLSDIRKQKNYQDIQNLSLVSRDSFIQPLLFVNYIDPMITRGFIVNEIAETKPSQFHLKTEKLDLHLQSNKPPLLVGGSGWITVCNRNSYYYSLTDLSASGTITLDGKQIPVQGKAWMDHQWANVSYRDDQWSWFSLQFDDGTDMMCVEYNDGKTKDCLVDLIEHNGKSEHYKNLLLRPSGQVWKSKKTKAQYPLVWTIDLPDKNAHLAVESMVTDQEMVFNAINYWEGPVTVRGTMSGKTVKGVGFMELVGYPSDYHYLTLLAKEFNVKIQKQFFDRLKNFKF